MQLEPWQAMAGLAGALVIVGLVAGLSDWSGLDVVLGFFFIGSILAATYAGWRIGKRFGR